MDELRVQLAALDDQLIRAQQQLEQKSEQFEVSTNVRTRIHCLANKFLSRFALKLMLRSTIAECRTIFYDHTYM